MSVTGSTASVLIPVTVSPRLWQCPCACDSVPVPLYWKSSSHFAPLKTFSSKPPLQYHHLFEAFHFLIFVSAQAEFMTAFMLQGIHSVPIRAILALCLN